MSLAGIIYDELIATGNFDQSMASYYSKGMTKTIEKAGYRLPPPLKPISDEEIIQQLQMNAPHGFDWTPTQTELRKGRIIRDAQLAADRKAQGG